MTHGVSVHRHRLTRLEHGEADSDLREVPLASDARLESQPPVEPADLPHVQDEPARAGSEKPVLGLLMLSLGNHRQIKNTPPPSRSS